MKETFIIIGEGPTEYFFLTSLKDEFFRKHPLHQFFTQQGGSIYDAISNAEKSMDTAEDRGYTFSELGRMFKMLGIEKSSLKGPIERI